MAFYAVYGQRCSIKPADVTSRHEEGEQAVCEFRWWRRSGKLTAPLNAPVSDKLMVCCQLSEGGTSSLLNFCYLSVNEDQRTQRADLSGHFRQLAAVSDPSGSITNHSNKSSSNSDNFLELRLLGVHINHHWRHGPSVI